MLPFAIMTVTRIYLGSAVEQYFTNDQQYGIELTRLTFVAGYGDESILKSPSESG